MGELGIPWYASYVFLGLSLSIGWLVYIMIRDSARRKKEKEEQERRLAESLAEELEAMEDKVRQSDHGDDSGKE